MIKIWNTYKHIIKLFMYAQVYHLPKINFKILILWL